MLVITASTWEVGMDLVPEDRASARSDEPEARSAARWRGRAAGSTPAGLAERWPLLASCPLAVRWLELQRDLGRSPRTIDAYARSLVDYLRFCERHGVEVVEAGRADIAGYVRAVDITRGVPGRPPAIAVTVSAPAEVSVIVAMIDRLPIVQPGGWNCPAQFAGSPRVQFVLRSAGGAVLARAAEDADVVEPTTPCDPLSFSVGGHPETALLHGASFLHAVARLTRARLAVGRP